MIPWSAFASAVFGGLIVAASNHFLTARRDRSKRFSDHRIKMLLEAWKKIEAASNIDDWKGRDKAKLYLDLEDAYASVILLGTDEQIAVAKKFAKSVGQGLGASSLDLLNLLRKNLREELGLSETKEDFFFLRMGPLV